MATHSSVLAWRTPWTVWKGKKIWHQKIIPPGQKVSNMLPGKSGGQLLIAPERTKRLGQSGNDAQLWIFLVMKVKWDAIKNSPDLEVAFCPRAVSPVSILSHKVSSASLLESRADSWSVFKLSLSKLACFHVPGCLQTCWVLLLFRTFHTHPVVCGHLMVMSLDRGYNTVLSIVEMSIQKLSANL